MTDFGFHWSRALKLSSTVPPTRARKEGQLRQTCFRSRLRGSGNRKQTLQGMLLEQITLLNVIFEDTIKA